MLSLSHIDSTTTPPRPIMSDVAIAVLCAPCISTVVPLSSVCGIDEPLRGRRPPLNRPNTWQRHQGVCGQLGRQEFYSRVKSTDAVRQTSRLFSTNGLVVTGLQPPRGTIGVPERLPGDSTGVVDSFSVCSSTLDIPRRWPTASASLPAQRAR